MAAGRGERSRALDAAYAIIDEGLELGLSPASIANRFLAAISRETGNPDPYFEVKAREMDFSRRAAREAAHMFEGRFDSLVDLCALGNSLDFFRDLGEVAEDLGEEVAYARDERETLEERLKDEARLVLLLADNAGEPFFDLPLAKHLRDRGHRVVYVVKSGPAQNDLTLDDLRRTGLHREFPEVVESGAATVGLVLEECSGVFIGLFESADVIIAKGMGHVETSYGLGDPRIFHLLKAKCPPVARHLGVGLGDFVAAFQPEGG